MLLQNSILCTVPVLRNHSRIKIAKGRSNSDRKLHQCIRIPHQLKCKSQGVPTCENDVMAGNEYH